MKFKFKNKKISSIVTVVPAEVKNFDDEIINYEAGIKRMQRLKDVMGFGYHRIVKPGTCISEMSVFGANYMLDSGLISKDDIGAVILVTESPDYFLPATSNVIQGQLGLSEDVYCLDINNGCCGYIIGLLQAFQLLEYMEKKILLLVGDILSSKVSPKDRKSYPLSGDAVSITIVENNKDEGDVFSEIKMDGTRSDALMIPAGGFKMPCTPETAIEYEDDDGNIRCLNNIVMKGGDVFNFMQIDVPPLVKEVLEFSNVKKEEVDWFLFHQPNKFMLEKLAEELEVPKEKMPNNIVSFFGNASGATIPTNICFNLGDRLIDNMYKVCLAGFGVGLAWGAIVMDLGYLSGCKIIEY